MKKILVLEDEEDISLLLATALKERGFEVETVENGKKALERLKNDLFDLVTVDIFMPEMSGWEVIDAILKSGNTPPIVIYSILESSWAFEKAKKLNCSFVTKSSGTSALLKEISNAIAS